MPDADQTDKPSDYGFGTFTCKDCPPEANVHPRKSNRGAPPQRCDPCKAAKHSIDSREGLNKLREQHGQAPLPPKEEEIQADAPPRPAPRHEPSWLDDDAAQELLRLKNEAVAAGAPPYDPDEHGTVEQYLAGVDLATVETDSSLTEDDMAQILENVDTDGPRVPRPKATAEYAEPAKVCAVGVCGIPDPVHAGQFCGNHWQQVSLEDRGILLGCAPDSEPFNQTMRRVLQKLGS